MHLIDALIERRGKIEIARIQLNLQVRIDLHRIREIRHDIRSLTRGGRPLILARLAVLKIPGAEGLNAMFEALALAIVQILARIVVEGGDVSRSKRAGLGIIIRTLA